MPAEAAITELGWEMINDLPPQLREDPDMRAVMHCYAKENERMTGELEALRRDLFPGLAADRGLRWWEWLLRLPVAPAGLTEAQRRDAVRDAFRALTAGPAGRVWELNVTAIVGPGWTYEEHIPGDVTTPPANTVRIHLPFPPDADLYARLERQLARFGWAGLDLELVYIGGFVLDESQLDQEGLG